MPAKITTKDGIELELSIGQVITDPAECDLIGKCFSDGHISGVVPGRTILHGWSA